MFAKRAAFVLFAVQLAAGAALAQEYGRTSGGELSLFTKQPNRFSGSLGISTSRSGLFGNNLKGYEATLGGTLLADHLWFFGTMERTNTASLTTAALPQFQPLSTASGKIDANLGDRQSLQAIAATSPVLTPTLSTVPARFYSMHYTGIISPNAFFTANVSQSVAKP